MIMCSRFTYRLKKMTMFCLSDEKNVELSSHYAALKLRNRPIRFWLTVFINLSTVIYFHVSHGSSTTQCSCFISDSVNPFPLRPMTHEFTLLTPLHPSLFSRSLPTSLSFSIFITVKATEACRGGTDFNTKGLSQPADISGEFSES